MLACGRRFNNPCLPRSGTNAMRRRLVILVHRPENSRRRKRKCTRRVRVWLPRIAHHDARTSYQRRAHRQRQTAPRAIPRAFVFWSQGAVADTFGAFEASRRAANAALALARLALEA
jgi:hypothetical protein